MISVVQVRSIIAVVKKHVIHLIVTTNNLFKADSKTISAIHVMNVEKDTKIDEEEKQDVDKI